MKKIYLLLVVLSSSTLTLSQTLFVPDASTNGIANSANENVGIGTASPNSSLHISSNAILESSTSTHDANLLIQGTGNRDLNTGVVLGFSLPANVDGSSPWQHGRIMVSPDHPDNARADGKMLLQTRYYTGSVWDWRDNLVLKSSGEVGIGIEDPRAQLEIYGGNLFIQRGGELNFSWEGSKRAGISATNTSPYNELQFFSGAYEEAMRIDSGGKVGIGTVSPNYLFEVEESNAIADSEYLLGAFNHSGNGGGIYLGYIGDGADAKEGRIRSGGSIDLSVGTTAYKQALYIQNSNGNVGIGTTSPDEKLTVKGTIHTEEVRVDLNVAAPDYVFEKDYDLRTLEDTETYISKNKHLPEIPSAAVMEANGVELGDMNMLLLKKIEELTLYVIEINKKVNQLETENKKLKTEISALKGE